MKEGSNSFFVLTHMICHLTYFGSFLDALVKSTCYLVYRQDFKIQIAIPFPKNLYSLLFPDRNEITYS